MAEWVYVLCTFTSICCAVMLMRGYMRSGRRLLLWSSLCFGGLSLNNLLLIFDLVLFPTGIDLSIWRTLPAIVGLMLLVYGLVWDTDETE